MLEGLIEENKCPKLNPQISVEKRSVSARGWYCSAAHEMHKQKDSRSDAESLECPASQSELGISSSARHKRKCEKKLLSNTAADKLQPTSG
jgi:hypothetical protein